ncbi:MAG TPA: histidine--tRNA ligase, partial [Mycobacteriales bacterium]|nr:histidine--tRNA ligase [Mycobacteriales bacterium]
MSELLPTAPYRGTRDFLPPEMSVREQVFHRMYGVIESFGYQRYDGPILESAEIYEAKSGTELAEQQLYTLTDKGGRRLALRPEMTPSVARMIAGHAGELTFPARWYTNVNCHRYERPQRGRLREHWQINVDVFGTESAQAELELVELIHALFAALGASPDMWRLRINDRVLLESMLVDLVKVPPAEVRAVSKLIDRWEKLPADARAADAAELGLSDDQFGTLGEALGSGVELLDRLPADVLERSTLVPVLRSVPELVSYDPLIVRGLDYYTGTVFEIFDTNPENPRALFGGGRYSDLAGLFTNQRIPGIGFAVGDVTLPDFLQTHGLLPEPAAATDAAVLPLAEDLFGPARTVAAGLRAAGLRTTVALEQRKLGKELTRVAKSGALVAVLVGAESSMPTPSVGNRKQASIPCRSSTSSRASGS